MREFRPDVVVTTYPLASLVLGRLRQQQRITVPAVTFVTDFAVHPLWVHPGIDLTCASTLNRRQSPRAGPGAKPARRARWWEALSA